MLWTVSWDRLCEYERDDMCVHYALQRMKGKASRVIRIILEVAARDQYSKEAEEDLLSVPALYVARHGEVHYAEKDYSIRTRNALGEKVEVISDMQGTSNFVPLLKVFNEYQAQFKNASAVGTPGGGMQELVSAPGGGDVGHAYIKPEPIHKVQTLDLGTLRQLLDVLVQDGCLVCQADPGGSGGGHNNKYAVRALSIIKTLKRKSIHRIATARYGVHGARIVEMFLAKNEWLEQSVIGDTAIIPARETREKLYLLYRDKWINFKEVSKRGDYSYASTTYYWHVEYAQTLIVVLEHCYEAMFNLRSKRASILRQTAAVDRDLESQTLALFIEAAGGATYASTTNALGGHEQPLDALHDSNTTDHTGAGGTGSSSSNIGLTTSNSISSASKSAIKMKLEGGTELGQAMNPAAQAILRGSVERERAKMLAGM